MKSILSLTGSIVGWVGVVLCLVAGLVKVSGTYYILDYEAMTVFTAGIGLIAAGALAKLEAIGLAARDG